MSSWGFEWEAAKRRKLQKKDIRQKKKTPWRCVAEITSWVRSRTEGRMSQFKVCVYESAVSQLPFRQGLTFRRPVPRHSWGVTQKPALSGFSTLLARTERGGVKRYAGIPFTFTSFSKSMYIVLQVKFKFRPTAPGSSVSFFKLYINI